MTYLDNTSSHISGGGSLGASRNADADSAALGLQTLLAQMWLWLQSCGLVLLTNSDRTPAYTPTDMEALLLRAQRQRSHKRYDVLKQALSATSPFTSLRARTVSLVTATYGFSGCGTAPQALPTPAEMKAQVQAIVQARMNDLRLRYIKWHNSRVWLWKNTHGLTCVYPLNVKCLRGLRHVRRPYAALIPD